MISSILLLYCTVLRTNTHLQAARCTNSAVRVWSVVLFGVTVQGYRESPGRVVRSVHFTSCNMQVFPFEQLARLRSLPESYEPPEPKTFKPRVDPSSWLADEQHRDQFVLRYSEPHPSGKLVRT